MKHRHEVQARATGGGVMPPDPAITKSYGGGDSVTAKAAKKRARGGMVSGKKASMRLDRPGRKMGGRVGADTSPLSSSARASNQNLVRDQDS